MDQTDDIDFNAYAELEAFEKAGDAQPMRIGGIVTTDALDKQGEKIVAEGLDFKPFLTGGWFNNNHKQGTEDIVGYPTGAKYVKKGETLPNGRAAGSNGWWAEGYLLDTEEGRRLWNLAKALRGTPRRLGFSIEGKVHSRRGAHVARAAVRNVAVTHCPVAYGTELEMLAKALTAGSAISAPGSATPGDGFALRGESLDDGAGDPWGDDKPEFELEPIDETDAVTAWAAASSRAIKQGTPAPRKLTKSEARIMIRAAKPNLTTAQVDAIVDHSIGG